MLQLHEMKTKLNVRGYELLIGLYSCLTSQFNFASTALNLFTIILHLLRSFHLILCLLPPILIVDKYSKHAHCSVLIQF